MWSRIFASSAAKFSEVTSISQDMVDENGAGSNALALTAQPLLYEEKNMLA
jgi:hypothetical protein